MNEFNFFFYFYKYYFVNFSKMEIDTRLKFFRVYYFFDGLSNDISHFVVAQNFIFSTCLSLLFTEKKLLIR